MAPCRDGIRRSRCVVVRNTRQMLWDTTIPDFLKWFPNGDAGILYKTDSKFLPLVAKKSNLLLRSLALRHQHHKCDSSRYQYQRPIEAES
jgi:hypothetical protein